MTSASTHHTGTHIEIIDNPGLRSLLRSIGEWSVTTLVWALWIYLFFPLINILLWVLGGINFYEKVIAHSDYLYLLKLVKNCGWATVGIFLALSMWGLYNYHRFGKKNRRISPMKKTPEEMADFFNLSPDRVAALQHQKEILWTSLYVPKKDQPQRREIWHPNKLREAVYE